MIRLLLIILTVSTLVLSTKCEAQEVNADSAKATQSLDSAGVKEPSPPPRSSRLPLGSAQTLLSYAAYTGSILFLVPAGHLDTAKPEGIGVAIAGMVSTLTSSLVIHMFGDYVMDGDGSYLSTWLGSVAGLIMTTGWQSQNSRIGKILHLSIPPVLGGLVGYWLSDRSSSNRTQLMPYYNTTNRNLGLHFSSSW